MRHVPECTRALPVSWRPAHPTVRSLCVSPVPSPIVRQPDKQSNVQLCECTCHCVASFYDVCECLAATSNPFLASGSAYKFRSQGTDRYGKSCLRRQYVLNVGKRSQVNSGSALPCHIGSNLAAASSETRDSLLLFSRGGDSILS